MQPAQTAQPSQPAAPAAVPVQQVGAPGAGAYPQQSASLYVGDLHVNCTEAKLFEVFNAIGPVSSIRICRDSITRRSLGYAYVNFNTYKDAERALDTMNYMPIMGKPCRIMWSQRDPSMRRSGAGNIFVKNLDKNIDQKALFDTFSLFGNILSCKVKTNRETGESMGYGFVQFDNVEDANRAIESVNGMNIEGKVVYVGHFKKRESRSSANNWTNLYVKNIPVEWDEDALSKLFGEHGEITSLKIMRGVEDDENKSRGFGFVNFATHDEAEAAIKALEGFKVGETEEGEDKVLFVGQAMKKSAREKMMRDKFAKLNAQRLQKYQGLNLYVKNLDDTIDDERLKAEFSSFGTITSAKVMRDEAGASRGFGFVCFSTQEEATKAVTEMSNKMVAGKPLYVSLAQRKEHRQAQLSAAHAARSGMARGMGMPGMMFMPGGMVPGVRPMMMPQGMGMPGAPFGPRPVMYPMNQRMAAQRGGNNQRGRGKGNGKQNFAFNQNARNQPNMVSSLMMQQGGPQGQQANPQQMQQMQQQMQQMQLQGQAQAQGQAPQMQRMAPAPLTAQALAAAPPAQQTNMIGERLYPLILAQEPERAGKITGMLLEMDNSELLNLLEDRNALKQKVQEAVAVLQNHQASS